MKRNIIIWIGVAVISVMGIFPPWRESGKHWMRTPQKETVKWSQARGCDFILPDLIGVPARFVKEPGTSWHIDWGRLFLQWSIVVLLTVTALYTFRKEKVGAK